MKTINAQACMMVGMSERLTNQPPFALAFETSSPLGSVALGRGSDVLDARTFTAPLRHAIEFLPTIEALCRTFNVRRIGAVYVSIGPGSFTGLRIGVTAARTLALAAERSGDSPVRLVPVPTLNVIAQNALDVAQPPTHVAVMIDAKRRRVYAALFVRKGGTYIPRTETSECDPAEFLSQCPPDTAVLGNGARVHSAVVEESEHTTLPERLDAPRAGTTYRLGTRLAGEGVHVAARDLVPLYIRPPEAEERWLKRFGERAT